MKNIAIFASGNGSNAENMINHFNICNSGGDTRVALVVCNRPDAGVIARAQRLGVPAQVMTRADINDEEKMMAMLESYGIDAIVLAGFLLMVPDFMLKAYPERIINVHPSLLPKYGGKGMYGINVHRAVVEAGETETGITIHYVTDKCDEGKIIFQTITPVSPTDTPEDVELKIHSLEREHFPKVVANILESISK